MWIKRNVVMLPTNEKASYSHEYKTLKGEIFPVMNLNQLILNKDNNQLSLNKNSSWSITCDTDILVPHHLYILSDEEIKVGDWFIWLKYNTIHKATKSDDNKECKKIIATTDKSLTINGYDTSDEEAIVKCFLPQIPQSFIEYFVSEYNKGNIITEVLVEYNELNTTSGSTKQELENNLIITETLKINPDNTINIKPIKDSWSRDEVKQLFINFTMTDSYSLPLNRNDRKEYVNTWIEENI